MVGGTVYGYSGSNGDTTMNDSTKKYTCIECKIQQDSPADNHTADGSDLCYICSKEYYVECADCSDLVREGDIAYTYKDNTICETCRNDDYTECADCNELLKHDSDLSYEDTASRSVCEDCSDTYCTDEIDDCIIHTDDAVSATHYDYRSHTSNPEVTTHINNVTCINDEYYTQDAVNELFVTCEGCGDPIDREEAFYAGDYSYCEGCYPGDGENIHYKDAGCEVIGHTFTDCTSRRRYGIEIECEASGGASNSNDTVFGSKEDGTLTSNGCEFYSPILAGDEGLQQLRQLCRILGDGGAEISDCCGLHIHIDLTDFNELELSRLFYLLRAMERITRRYVSKSRARNSYCKGSLEGKVFFDHYRSSNYPLFRGLERYSAYNFESYNTHRTIECRLHAGSIDYTEISNWVKLHLAIVDYAKNDTSIGHTDNSIRELLHNLTPELYHYYSQKEISYYPDETIPSVKSEDSPQSEESENAMQPAQLEQIWQSVEGIMRSA